MEQERFVARRPHLVPAAIAAAMLLGALGKWSYDYYRLLRWVTCAVAVFMAYQGYTWKRFWVPWLFGFVAILFNPLIPIHIKRQTWQIIDVLAAGIFLFAIIALAKPTRPKDEGEKTND